jgi:NADH dehydrogenase FAD-containing subunit
VTHHVVIVGAGFAGLAAAHGLAGADVKITIIDQRNHHLFQPLLYQVGTASLATSEIAWPIRHLMRKRKEVTTLLGVVTGVDTQNRAVLLEDGGRVNYDTLVLATGARHAYFGHDEWEPYAPGLKTLEDATSIRRRVLLSFEHAERETDPQRRAALLTFVIVGGGPTGVELAGAIAELAHQNLPQEYRHIDTRRARVVLIEAGPRILPSFTEDLSAYAHASLERLGVEIQLGSAVRECSSQGVIYGDRPLAAKVILWAAGVRASAAAAWAGLPADNAGRAQVEPDLTAPGNLRDRRYRDHQCLGRQAGARNRSRGEAAGRACGRHHPAAPGRRHRAANLPLQAFRQSSHHRQTRGRHRFRYGQGAWLACLVDLGARPHLLLDRGPQSAGRCPELAVDLCHRQPQRLPDHPGRTAAPLIRSVGPSFGSSTCRCGATGRTRALIPRIA